MDNDIHKDCFHCKEVKAPMWPVTDLEAWKMEVCRTEAFTEYCDRNVEEMHKDIEKRLKKEAERKKNIENKRRDQKVKPVSTIRDSKLGLLNINAGGIRIMARKNKTETQETAPETKPLKKTALIDQLLGANLEGSYLDGAVDSIATQVVAAFPELDAKRVRGLIFSRRAVLKKAASPETAAA